MWGNEQFLEENSRDLCRHGAANEIPIMRRQSLVSEMLKRLPLFMGKEQASDSWKIVQLVSQRKPDAERRKGTPRGSGPGGSSVKVVRDVCCSSHGKEAELKEFEELHVGGVSAASTSKY